MVRGTAWTPVELKRLTRYFPTGSRILIEAKIPRRTWTAIKVMAAKRHLSRKFSEWSPEDNKILELNYLTLGLDYVGGLLPERTPAAIIRQACKLGYLRSKRRRRKPKAAKGDKTRRAVEAAPPEKKQAAQAPRAAPAAPAKKAPAKKAPAKEKAAALNPEPVLGPKKKARSKGTPSPPVNKMSADYVRSLPMTHPDRIAYNRAQDERVRNLIPVTRVHEKTGRYYTALLTPKQYHAQQGN